MNARRTLSTGDSNTYLKKAKGIKKKSLKGEIKTRKSCPKIQTEMVAEEQPDKLVFVS